VRFSHKVILMPVLAGGSFLGALLINEVTGRANARLIRAIQQEYLPALELRRGVESALLDVQRSLQDAVAAADPDGVQRADALAEELLARLRAGRTNRAFRPGEVVALEKAFTDYYAWARGTSLRMMKKESGVSLESALEAMGTQYASLRAGLEASTARQRDEMQRALEQASENHRRSVHTMTAALVLGLVALALVSRAVIRSTIGSMRQAVATAAALSGRAAGEEPGRRSGDEITQLLDSMQTMMAALARSEGRLKEAQRLAHLGSWEWDLANSRATWSEEMFRLFGIANAPPRDPEGMLALVHPDDRAQAKVVLLAGVAARWPFHHQLRIVRPDGEARTILTYNEVVLDDQGAVTALRGAVQDLTDIERTAVALRESEERYRMLFENNPQPMWVYDVESLSFLAVNKAAVAHYGYTREEFLRMTIADIRLDSKRDALKARIAGAGPGMTKAGIWRHRRKDGSLLDVDISSHSVSFGTVPARLVLATDVTERGRLEHQLRQAQKMEAVGRLAGGVAHDFNNILGVIMGYADLVARRMPSGDPLAGKVREILKAAERAAGLTRQLLDLNVVMGEMDKMLRRLIGENIELKTRLQENLSGVMADPGQMEQVIMNLAVNARDAMPKGGSLLLETRNVDLDAAYARMHPTARTGPHVMVAVSDTGEGMDAETMARIFEPFFTTKPLGKGTGLGLSTVHGIVEQSGGSVEVYSEKGRGTTFRIYLPSAEGKAETAAVAAPTPAPGGSETVLLVEDEAALRSMLREALEDAGYRVLEAGTPAHALAIAESHLGNIHMMLTDVVMPGMSGRELAERLKSLRSGVAVVYMSGYTDDAIGQHGLLDLGTHFLQKPFTSHQLLEKCREVLGASDAPPAPEPGAGRTRSAR
jgi:PAS domain S-box-containing protein